MSVLVVGSGVAGPATAIALQQVGIRATLLEAHDHANTEVGSWFTIAPNGIAVLAELGILDDVRDLGVPTRYNLMLGATGRSLGRLAIGRPLDDGTPALSFKRTRLAARLVEIARSRGIDVRTGCRVATAVTTDAAAEVELSTGVRLGADMVIGADGIH